MRQDVPRREVPLKTTGAAKYGSTAVPGMVYAAGCIRPTRAVQPECGRCRYARDAGITDVVKCRARRRGRCEVEGTQAARKAQVLERGARRRARQRTRSPSSPQSPDSSRTGVPGSRLGRQGRMAKAAVVFHSEVYRTRTSITPRWSR